MSEALAKKHLHSMVVSLLTYEPKAVLHILRRHYDWNVLKVEPTYVRPEARLRRRYADVVWYVRGRYVKFSGRKHYVVENAFLIGFEVKTGRFREEWIDQLRAVRGELVLSGRRFPGVRHTIVILMCPESEVEKAKEKIRSKLQVNLSNYRVVPLELLSGLLKSRLKMVLKLLGDE